MTDSELIDHLAGLVEKATPGEWKAEHNIRCRGWVDLVTDDFTVGIPTTATDLNGRDYSLRNRTFDYIAACNPENIKRLLELARKGAEQ